MENCCSCYHTEPKTEYRYDTRGNCVTYEHTIGKCWGTKECEECFCKGDRSKCDYYSDIKAKAQKEVMENSKEYEITKAIELLTKNGYKVSKGEMRNARNN